MAEPDLRLDLALVRADGVSAGYGREPVIQKFPVVGPASSSALVGPNGTRQVHPAQRALGALAPRSGSVQLFGEVPDRFHPRWRLGYVPQRPSLESEVPATVREIVASGRLRQRGWWRRQSPEDRATIQHAIESVDLGDLADRR